MSDYDVRENEAAGDVENTGDKIKAGAKAVRNKMKDPDKDTGTEYEKEKLKEEVKDQF